MKEAPFLPFSIITFFLKLKLNIKLNTIALFFNVKRKNKKKKKLFPILSLFSEEKRKIDNSLMHAPHSGLAAIGRSKASIAVYYLINYLAGQGVHARRHPLIRLAGERVGQSSERELRNASPPLAERLLFRPPSLSRSSPDFFFFLCSDTV